MYQSYSYDSKAKYKYKPCEINTDERHRVEIFDSELHQSIAYINDTLLQEAQEKIKTRKAKKHMERRLKRQNGVTNEESMLGFMVSGLETTKSYKILKSYILVYMYELKNSREGEKRTTVIQKHNFF